MKIYVVIRRIRHTGGGEEVILFDDVFRTREQALRFIGTFDMKVLTDAARIWGCTFAHDVRELTLHD